MFAITCPCCCFLFGLLLGFFWQGLGAGLFFTVVTAADFLGVFFFFTE